MTIAFTEFHMMGPGPDRVVIGGGEPLTRKNISEFMEECSETLKLYSTPKEERWMVVPKWMVSTIQMLATNRGHIALIRNDARSLKLRGGARAAYIRSRVNTYKLNPKKG